MNHWQAPERVGGTNGPKLLQILQIILSDEDTILTWQPTRLHAPFEHLESQMSRKYSDQYPRGKRCPVQECNEPTARVQTLPGR